MDIERIDSDLKFANQVGATLNIEEKLKLNSQLNCLGIFQNQLYQNLTSHKILKKQCFGERQKDYYIVVGLRFKQQALFPQKQFFWASTEFNFAELPEYNQSYKEYLESIHYLFTGMQQNQLSKLDEELNPDNKMLPKTKLTELDRLSFVVNQIENECQLVPLGGLQMTPTKELQYNAAFNGLTIFESQELKYYQHFRKQRSEEKQKQIERGDYLFKFDFLDSLEDDLPIGAWSIQSDITKTMVPQIFISYFKVTLRSLVWPGFIGYHRTNSNIFGGIYFGQGLRNNDLPFLL